MDGEVVRGLRSRGIDLVTAAEAGMIRRTDKDHLSFATAQGRVLYSFNVGDFHETSRKPEQVPRPAEFFFDGILAGQEGVGDFGNAETAKRLEDECHLDFG